MALAESLGNAPLIPIGPASQPRQQESSQQLRAEILEQLRGSHSLLPPSQGSVKGMTFLPIRLKKKK